MIHRCNIQTSPIYDASIFVTATLHYILFQFLSDVCKFCMSILESSNEAKHMTLHDPNNFCTLREHYKKGLFLKDGLYLIVVYYETQNFLGKLHN